MKNALILSLILLFTACSHESIKRTLDNMGQVMKDEPGLSTTEVAAGLREALVVGVNNAVATSSIKDGFYKDPRLFIPFPEEAQKVKSTAMNLGLKTQVDRFEETLNRAAEEAVKEATPIFVNAITSMTINDAFAILRGNNDAATHYLRSRTENELTGLFKPKVDDAIAKVELTKYWNPLASAYNTASTFTGGQAINPDLTQYVTDKTMEGLFTRIADEEEKIRQNPAARVSDLLRKVFGATN